MEHSKASFQLSGLAKPLVIGCLALLVISTVARAQSIVVDTTEQVQNLTVAITAEYEGGKTQRGFGFVVGTRNSTVFIITANHVVRFNPKTRKEEKAKHVTVKFFREQDTEIDASLLGFHDKSLDLAVLRVHYPYLYGFDTYKKCLADEKTIGRGTLVWFVGRDAKWYVPSPTSPGSINEITVDFRIQAEDLDVHRGTSGAPLFSESGIVGIIVTDETKAFTRAVRIDLVRRFAQKNKIPWQLADYQWVSNAPKYYVGLGIGYGKNSVSIEGVEDDYSMSGLSGNLRGGKGFRGNFLVGLEFDTWTKEDEGITFTFYNIGLALSYYFTEKFFVKAGPALAFGSAEGDQEVEYWVYDDFGYPLYSYTETEHVKAEEKGYGLTFGLGYQHHWSPESRFAVVPSLIYTHQNLETISTNIVSFNLGFIYFW